MIKKVICDNSTWARTSLKRQKMRYRRSENFHLVKYLHWIIFVAGLPMQLIKHCVLNFYVFNFRRDSQWLKVKISWATVSHFLPLQTGPCSGRIIANHFFNHFFRPALICNVVPLWNSLQRFAVRLSEASRQSLACGLCTCDVLFIINIHNAWVPMFVVHCVYCIKTTS